MLAMALRKKDPGEKFPWEYLSRNKIGIWHTLDISKSLTKSREIRNKWGRRKYFFQKPV